MPRGKSLARIEPVGMRDLVLALPSSGTVDAMQVPTPRFLLARPDWYDIAYSINPFMAQAPAVDTARAREQWQSLHDQLVRAGAEVVVQPGAQGCPDLVFTNNAALVMDGRALMTRFRFRERDGEVRVNRRTLRTLGFDVTELPARAGAFEGAADAIPHNGHLVCAWGPRTDRSSHAYLAAFTGMPIVEVELVDPRFYHLDMVFCPLGDGRHALVAPDAMSADSYARVCEVVPDPLALTLEEALSFCGNAVVVGSRVFMHSVPVRVDDMLADAGYDAVSVPAGEFLKSGGSLACMSLRLNRPFT